MEIALQVHRALSVRWFQRPLAFVAPRHIGTSLLPCCCRCAVGLAGGGVPARQYSASKLPTARAAKRLEKMGLGPDGKPLPAANTKKIFPRMYKVLMVNQDGSTYTFHHRYPHQILPLPLDPSSLSEEERAAREKQKMAAKARVYVDQEEEEDEEQWDQSKYRALIRDT